MKEKIFKVEIIKDFMEKNNLSKIKFCELCKIKLPILNKIFNQQINFRVNNIFRIAFYMQIEIKELFFKKTEK